MSTDALDRRSLTLPDFRSKTKAWLKRNRPPKDIWINVFFIIVLTCAWIGNVIKHYYKLQITDVVLIIHHVLMIWHKWRNVPMRVSEMVFYLALLGALFIWCLV